MKVILNYDEQTGQVTDAGGMVIITWHGLNYEPVYDNKQSSGVDGEQLIRIMKIAAHVENPSEIKEL